VTNKKEPVGRKSLSKSLRFEIFKRDGFRCLYCGCSPSQKVLRVDHVVPVAEGGSDESSNLVTSCFDCNAGKAARRLEDVRLSAGIAGEADLEHAEQIREWLRVQREVEAARLEVAQEIARYWEDRLGGMTQEMFDRLPKLAKEWGIERLHEAINIVGRKFAKHEEFDSYWAVKHQKYFHGILRKWREGVE